MPPDLMVAVRGPSLVSEGSIEEKRKGERREGKRRDKREVRRKEREAVNNFLQGAHNHGRWNRGSRGSSCSPNFWHERADHSRP